MAEVEVGVSFAKAWKSRSHVAMPERIRSFLFAEYGKFRDAVQDPDEEFADLLVGALLAGDVLIIRGAFPSQFMKDLKEKTVAWTKSRPASFHKMLEGSPDFHRIIDLETGRNYAFAGCKHSAYFYRWNDDPLGIWPEISERWRIMKTVMGLRPDEYEANTPKDGVVDRIQVVRYPPAIGYLEPHQDPYLHQRVFFSAYMSKRGVDFHGGGFYFVGTDDQVVEVEDQLEVGDICVGCATVMHGVAPCDRNKKPDWEADDGRWFLSLYSNASDEVPKRHTGHPVKLSIPGVLP